MVRSELVQRVGNALREKDIRKPISFQKKVFHITDDEGNTSDFVIKKTNKGVLYTNDDVNAIIGACVDVIEDALKHGEEISFRGFGTLGLHYRKPRSTKHPETGEYVDVPGRYLPKFNFGNELRMCAKVYELSLNGEEVPERCEDILADDEDGELDGD